MAGKKASLRKIFKTIIWPRRILLLLGLILIIINRLSGLVLPGASKYLIDEVIGKGVTHFMKLLLTGVAGAIVVQSVTSYYLTRLLSVEAQNLISKLRSEVQQHIIQLPTRFFDNTKSGELVSRIMTDVEGVRNLVGTGLVQLVGGTLTSIISVFFLIKFHTFYFVSPLFPRDKHELSKRNRRQRQDTLLQWIWLPSSGHGHHRHLCHSQAGG